MDAVAKFGSAQGCAVRTGALERDLFSKRKNVLEWHSFAYVSLATERKVMSPRGETSQQKLNNRLDELRELQSKQIC